MKISYKLKKLSIVVAMVIFSGCGSDFINKPPISEVTSSVFFTSKNDMLSSTGALYNLAWFEFNDISSFSIGDSKGGVFYTPYAWQGFWQYKVDENDGNVVGVWKSMFNVVAQANITAGNINRYTKSTVSEDDKNAALGECKFMRGVAYFYAISNWGKGVPLIEDNEKYIQDVLSVRRNTPKSVYEFIIRDLTFAKTHLPLVPAQPGRLTSWAAKGMLAKIYLFRASFKKGLGEDNTADLDSAKANAADVCKNSGLTLMDNYENLFKTAYNSSKGTNTEYLFALQWVAGGGYNFANTLQGQLAFDNKVTGQSDGWGGGHGASQSILKYYVSHPEDSVRRKATFFFPGERYDYMTYEYTDPNDASKTILDKLVVPLQSDTNSPNKATCKKYIVGRAQDNNGEVFPWGDGSTSINTYMLRLAEIYLIYAEATALLDGGATSDADAVDYFNRVRTRAKIATLSPPITFKNVFDEKRIELAMEGHAWYELQRLYMENPQNVLNMIDTTQTGEYRLVLRPGSSPKKWNLNTYNDGNFIKYVEVTQDHFYLPYPAKELTLAPNLLLDAVEYDFSAYK